jgi:sec-independent protein translocase protein TatA
MLGLDNPIHIAFLLILLLLVFGAKRLPEMGKSLGAGMRGFKDSLTGETTQPTLAAEPPASAVTSATTVVSGVPSVASVPAAPAGEPQAPSAA